MSAPSFSRNIFNPRVFMRAMKEFGPMQTLRKLYWYDELKFGTLIGKDQFGNEYFENKEELSGQHRWIEFNPSNGPYDASRVPAEWHGWLHHMTDSPGNAPTIKPGKANSWGSSVADAMNFEGGVKSDHTPHGTGFKDRGYGVGSVFSAPGENRVYSPPGNVMARDFDPQAARPKVVGFDIDAFNAKQQQGDPNDAESGEEQAEKDGPLQWRRPRRLDVN